MLDSLEREEISGPFRWAHHVPIRDAPLRQARQRSRSPPAGMYLPTVCGRLAGDRYYLPAGLCKYVLLPVRCTWTGRGSYLVQRSFTLMRHVSALRLYT